MSCLYRKIIALAIWQHWVHKVTFCSFFIFRTLFFGFYMSIFTHFANQYYKYNQLLTFLEKKNNLFSFKQIA